MGSLRARLFLYSTMSLVMCSRNKSLDTIIRATFNLFAVKVKEAYNVTELTCSYHRQTVRALTNDYTELLTAAGNETFSSVVLIVNFFVHKFEL